MADSPAPEADQSSDVEVAAPQPNLAVPSSPLRLNPPRQEPSNHPQKPCLWLRTRNNELIDLLSDDDERSRANRRPPQTVVSGSTPPTLPPSVEQAYKIKCIALKKRLNEVNASNDAVRERIVRQTRAVRKLRLERAILLNRLADIINKNGADVESLGIVYDDDSEGSSEGPPTQPHEKPLRSKRPHRRPMPSPPPALAPSPSTHATPGGGRHRHHPYEPHYPSQDRHDNYGRTRANPSSSLTNGHRFPSSHPVPSTAGQQINLNEPPPDIFTYFLNKVIRENHEFRGLSESQQLNKAKESWVALPRTEIEAMTRDYQERLAAWQNALQAVKEEQNAGEGMEVVKGEGQDEEMEGVGQGGFTAVNE